MRDKEGGRLDSIGEKWKRLISGGNIKKRNKKTVKIKNKGHNINEVEKRGDMLKKEQEARNADVFFSESNLGADYWTEQGQDCSGDNIGETGCESRENREFRLVSPFDVLGVISRMKKEGWRK